MRRRQPLQHAVPLAHIDGLTVQLIQRQAAPRTRVIEGRLVRPRSASSKGHDGRDSLAPRLGLTRGAPSQYQNTTVRVTEAALPTLERIIAVAQSDFREDAHALDIIDWIRAELMAGRGPAFKSEEAGGGMFSGSFSEKGTQYRRNLGLRGRDIFQAVSGIRDF